VQWRRLTGPLNLPGIGKYIGRAKSMSLLAGGAIERGRDQDKSSANLMADFKVPSFAGVNVVRYFQGCLLALS
jgi:hypothetical protein